MTTTNEPAGIDLDKLEALARKAYLANEVVAMIPPAKILDLIAQSRASQPEGATLASQEGITGTSQEETTGASESSQKLRGWLKGTVVTLPADFLHSVADELDDLRAQLAATTENLQTAVRQAWEANAELSKLRAAPASAQPDRGAAHAQQEAAPAEVTKSQERDYNWLLGLAKSKGYHTVYGALYAAPTAVPYLGILPSHSEREAANAGGLPVDLIHDFRDAINIAHHRADHAGDTTRMKRWKEVSRRLEAYVRTINAPATIAAGQEAANAKDAGVPTFFPGDEVRAWNEHFHCWNAVVHRAEVRWSKHRTPHISYIVKDKDGARCTLPAWRVGTIERAAMADVGAAGQEGGNHG